MFEEQENNIIQKIIEFIKKIFQKAPNHTLSFFGIFFVILITRIPFMTKYLFEWDSVQLALGMREFNIVKHQPHPPGYFLYVYISKFINFFVSNPNYSMIIVNILLLVIASLIFYKFCYKLFQNKIISFLCSLIVISNPYVWFHSEFANVYMIDFTFALIFFSVTYEIIFEKKNKIALFSLLFALSAGFRQSLLLFFTPMYLFAFFVQTKRQKKYIKNIFINLTILFFVSLVWLIPTIIFSGELNTFLENTKNQYISTTEITSVFNKGHIIETLSQIFNTLKLLIYSSGILFILIMFNIIFKKFKFKKDIKIILWLWFLPSFLFFSFIHLGKVGYIMTLLPLMLILGICAIYRIKNNEKKYFAIFLIVIIQTPCFFIDWSALREYPKFKHFLINTQPYDVDNFALRKNDVRLDKITSAIKKFNPEETIIVSEAGSPHMNLKSNFIKNVRFLNYYLPNYYNIYLYNNMGMHRVDYKNQSIMFYHLQVSINKNIKNFILVTDDYNHHKYELQKIDLGTTQIYFQDISNINTFEYINFDFIKQ